MITHINKNVVCIKEIPSNLLEEAIFILKADSEKTNKKRLQTRNEIILQESNELISSFMNDFEKRKKEIDLKKESWRKKILMLIIIVTMVSLILLLSLSYFSS